jgi:iron complex outermembrane receptor protein
MNYFVKTLILTLGSSLSIVAVQSIQTQEVSAQATEPLQKGTVAFSSATVKPTATILEVTELMPPSSSEIIAAPPKITKPMPASPNLLSSVGKKTTPKISELSALPLASTRAIDLMAQDTPKTEQVVKVTGVSIQPTSTGMEIKLVSPAADRLASSTQVEGNTLITVINNAVLALPEGQPFRQQNPSVGISEVTVTQVQPTQIQVRVTGVEAVPGVNVTSATEGLMLAVTPGLTAEEETEITVTAEQEQEGYRVPNASTATKTDTPLRDIPQSIQVIPRQVIEDQGSTRISDITRNVSGVNTTTGPSGVGEFFTIRGFSGNEFGASNEFRNGFRSLGLGSFNTSNIERVEVLKGPASVLYGQIEPGGLINFVSKQPLDHPYFSGEVEIGSFDFYKPSLDISGPLTKDKRLLSRLNFSYENSRSFVDFVDRQIVQVAPSLTYNISEDTKLTLAYEYLKQEGTNNPGLPRDPIAFDLPRERFLGEPGDTVDSESQALTLGLEHRFSENWQLRSRFAWQAESFKRNAFRIGRDLEEDGRTLGRFLQVDLEDRTETYSIQTDVIGKFKTGPIAHQLLFGIEWVNFSDRDATGFATVDGIDIFTPVYGATRPTLFDDGADRLTTQSDAIGLYLQDQITLLPNLKLLVGGRYEFIDETSGLQTLDATGVTEIDELAEDSFSNQAFSPRVGIVYQPIEPISLYASYSSSFVPNNTLTSTGELIEPTRGTQFEVGVKAESLDGNFAAILSAYQITKTNVLRVDPVNPDFSIPIGEVRSRGIELDLTAEPLSGWNIIASAFLNDSVVTVGDESNPVGDILIDAPGSGASLWTTYEIQTGDLKGLGFGAGLFYLGEVEAELPNSFVLPSYVRADATLFYKRDNWRVSLNFKNLFNTDTFTNQGAAIYPGEPFTVLGSVSVSF